MGHPVSVILFLQSQYRIVISGRAVETDLRFLSRPHADSNPPNSLLEVEDGLEKYAAVASSGGAEEALHWPATAIDRTVVKRGCHSALPGFRG